MKKDTAEYLTKVRQHLHQIAELSGYEKNTRAYLAEQLNLLKNPPEVIYLNNYLITTQPPLALAT